MTYYAYTTIDRAAGSAASAARFMAAVAGAVKLPARALRRHVAIKRLEQLDDHLLCDIGVERDKIRNAVCGRQWTRREIRIPYDIFIEMSPTARDWVRRTSPANGFADAGRPCTLNPMQLAPFGIWIARSNGSPSGRAGRAYAARHPDQSKKASNRPLQCGSHPHRTFDHRQRSGTSRLAVRRDEMTVAGSSRAGMVR